MLGENLNIVRLNNAAEILFGLVSKDTSWKNVLDIAPNIKDTGRYDQYLKVLKTREPFFAEDIVTDPRFGDIHLSIKAFKVGDGLGIIASDITKRKQAEEALRESEERFRALTESTSDWIWEVDTNGGLRHLNLFN